MQTFTHDFALKFDERSPLFLRHRAIINRVSCVFIIIISLVLRERPKIRLSTLDLSQMSALPDGSLGKEYLRFLEDNVNEPKLRR